MVRDALLLLLVFVIGLALGYTLGAGALVVTAMSTSVALACGVDRYVQWS